MTAGYSDPCLSKWSAASFLLNMADDVPSSFFYDLSFYAQLKKLKCLKEREKVSSVSRSLRNPESGSEKL